MDRHWLLTNTSYGTWLPGAERGFVGRVWEHRLLDPLLAPRVAHPWPGTDFDENMPGLETAARQLLKAPPIRLTMPHAETALAQFRETADHRGWAILAVAIMFNHFHMVVGVPGEATRAFTKRFGQPKSETWWTERGSKRKLPSEEAILAAIHYVLYEQPNPLLTWSPETGLHYGRPPQASVEP